MLFRKIESIIKIECGNGRRGSARISSKILMPKIKAASAFC